MGEYREVNGDLLKLASQGIFDIVAHGCNCQKTMGAGIALQIAHRFPQAYEIDRMDDRLPIERLGDMTISSSILMLNKNNPRPEETVETREVRILNLYIQLFPGRNLSRSALRLCLVKVNMMFSGQSIGLPLIGCGIGGDDWREVKEIVVEELKDMNVTIVHYSGDMIKRVPPVFSQRLL